MFLRGEERPFYKAASFPENRRIPSFKEGAPFLKKGHVLFRKRAASFFNLHFSLFPLSFPDLKNRPKKILFPVNQPRLFPARRVPV